MGSWRTVRLSPSTGLRARQIADLALHEEAVRADRLSEVLPRCSPQEDLTPSTTRPLTKENDRS